jgi:hypothetical protein
MARKKDIEPKDMESEELAKLRRIFSDIPDDMKATCESLMRSAAFMASELKKLQDYIREHGWVEEYQNGATQTGKKPSSEAQAFNQLIKNYNTVLKTLIDMLPREERKAAKTSADPFAEFLGSK